MVYNLGVLYVCVNSALRYSRGVGSFWTGSSEGDWGVWEHWEGTEDIKIVGICLLEFHLSYFMNACLIHLSFTHTLWCRALLCHLL